MSTNLKPTLGNIYNSIKLGERNFDKTGNIKKNLEKISREFEEWFNRKKKQ